MEKKTLREIINDSINKRRPYSTCPTDDWPDTIMTTGAYIAGVLEGTANYCNQKRNYRDMQSPVKYK